MSTIAFKDGVIAADTQLTDSEDYFLCECEKVKRFTNGSLLASVGDDDIRDLYPLFNIDNYSLENEQWSIYHLLPSRSELAALQINYTGLFLYNREIFKIDIDKENDDWYGNISKLNWESNYAIGSGSKFALGAMLNGATAEEAVKIAAKVDVYTSSNVLIWET